MAKNWEYDAQRVNPKQDADFDVLLANKTEGTDWRYVDTHKLDDNTSAYWVVYRRIDTGA